MNKIGSGSKRLVIDCNDDSPMLDPFKVIVIQLDDGNQMAFKEFSFEDGIDFERFDIHDDPPHGYRIVPEGAEIESIYSYETVNTPEEETEPPKELFDV